jgi:hypothetical protein
MRVDHSFLDRRSLAFHVAIAEKLRTDPKLLEKFRDRLQAMLSDDRVSISTRDAYREWLDFIEEHSFEEVLDLWLIRVRRGRGSGRLRHSLEYSARTEREAIDRKAASIQCRNKNG